MEIKKILRNTLNFSVSRLIETLSLIVVVSGVLLLISLLSYSPEDPNFIFPDNTNIKNIFGIKGSFISDLFFQSIGLIALLIPFSLIITGINIFLTKKFFFILESLFYITLYSLFGSLFLSNFYSITFKLYINGNGGFIGKYLETTFLNSLININTQFSYFILLFLILVLFLISIQFKLKGFLIFFRNLFSKKEKNYTNENEIIESYIPQDEIKNLIQEDLPFIKNENKIKNNKFKFKLPLIDLLKKPSTKNTDKINNENYVDSEFLEKILLDFGVNGNIKKVSHGPVVTLNEFEPAAGVKVSKIINLSDDIARNTSSESARIATIPGRSTIGIELINVLY